MMVAAATALPEALSERVPIRAFLLGERLETRGLERRGLLATAPLTFRLSEGGIAIFFRYGVVVLFNVSLTAEKALLDRIAPFVTGPFQVSEIDDAQLQIDSGSEEGLDPAGTILVKQADTERLQLVADALAKSLILSHYEMGIADIFDRIEPLATTMKEKGRTGASGTDLLRHIGNVLLIQHKMVGRVETGEKPELL